MLLLLSKTSYSVEFSKTMKYIMYTYRTALNSQLLFSPCSYVFKSFISHAVDSEDYGVELLSSDHFSVLLINDASR